MKDRFELELNTAYDYVTDSLGLDIKKECRGREYSEARTLFVAIASKTTNASRKVIGEHINRDHSTVTYTVRKLVSSLLEDDKYKSLYHTFIDLILADSPKGKFNKRRTLTTAINEINNLKKHIELSENEKAEALVVASAEQNLTDNERAYRELSDEDAKIYDERANLVLKSFAWKRKDDNRKEVFETINIG